jgi:hypothetical protein
MEQIDKIVVVSYAIIGALFMYYFFIIYLRKELHQKIRVPSCLLFLTASFMFFSASGKIMSGYNDILTHITLWTCVAFAACGFYLVKGLTWYHKRHDCDRCEH